VKTSIISVVVMSAVCCTAIAQDEVDVESALIELPTGPIEYEMRLGPVDLSCGLDFKYSDSYDQEAKILDATVEFLDSSGLSNDPDKYALVKVTTGSVWLGLIEIETGSIRFDTKKLVDVTDDELLEEYGIVNAILAVDSVSAEYIRGTIDGKITAYRHAAHWLKGVAGCEGEGTILMLPK